MSDEPESLVVGILTFEPRLQDDFMLPVCVAGRNGPVSVYCGANYNQLNTGDDDGTIGIYVLTENYMEIDHSYPYVVFCFPIEIIGEARYQEIVEECRKNSDQGNAFIRWSGHKSVEMRTPVLMN